MSYNMSYRGRGNYPQNYTGAQDQVYYNRNYPNQSDYENPPSTSRGRGRGKGRGRGSWNKNKTNPPNDKTPDKTEKPELTTVPEPKHLSKTSSELTNDPLYEESFFKDFGSSLRRDVDDPRIHSGTTGLKFITENIYKVLITKAARFAKRMPESALAYYFSILTNQRLIKIKATKFVQDIDNVKYYYPKSFSRYLSGFGNTRVQGGRNLKFLYPLAVARKVTVNNLRWWGAVNERTHHLYLNYPCPAVYYRRIALEYLGDEVDEDDDDDRPNDIVNWNLPPRIRANFGWPNVNLQGWKPLGNMTGVQRSFLDAADFDPRAAPRGLEWSYNPALMNAVSVELENLRFVEAGSVPESSGGSQGQTTFSTCYGDDMYPMISGEFIGKSNLDISGPIANMGIKHLYRIKYDDTLRNWSIYWTGVFDDVPDAWALTINHWRNAEYPELNVGRYNMEIFDPREFVRLIVERDNRKIVKK